VKAIVVWLLDHLCSLTGHAFGCALLNRVVLIGYDEHQDVWRFEIPNRVTYPLWCWAMELP
jgi:hypothetical protein